MDSPPRSQSPLNNSSPNLTSDFKQAFLSPSQLSKQRWKILSLILINTLAYSFAYFLLLKIAVDKPVNFDQSEPRKYVFLAPILFGILIYHFDAKRAYQFISGASALAVTLALLDHGGVGIRHNLLFNLGHAAFYGSYLGLFVAHMSLIAKYFREKELSLAMGTLILSPLISSYLGSILYPSRKLSESGGLSILYLIGISCLLGIITVLFLAKLDKKPQDEVVILEEPKVSLIEDLRFIKPVTFLLMGGIFLFCLTNYFSILINALYTRYRNSGRSDENIERCNRMLNLSNLVAAATSILFALLADKIGKRIIMMLLSFLVALLGVITMILDDSSPDFLFLFLASVILYFATYSFYTFSWACLSLSVPQRVFGIIFGLTYGAMFLKDWANNVSLPICLVACVLGATAMIAGLVLNKKNGGNLDSFSMKDDDKVTDTTSFTTLRVDNS